jgi:hypothetical protein
MLFLFEYRPCLPKSFERLFMPITINRHILGFNTFFRIVLDAIR